MSIMNTMSAGPVIGAMGLQYQSRQLGTFA